RDPNRGTIYDGPMALLVNAQSASASEMLAGTLQDYNRAVIIGSTTFGKATMQALFPLDTVNLKATPSDSETELAKVTVGKIFRVNGHTAQLTGVIPDIILPDAFDGLPIGERFEISPLNADTVAKNNYYKPLALLPIGDLSAKSKTRLTNNVNFVQLSKMADAQRKIVNEGKMIIPLQPDQFGKWRQQQDVFSVTPDCDNVISAAFTADNHAQDKQKLLGDDFEKEINDMWLKNISCDLYIQEAASVLTDLINITKTTSKN
ncbi:MAG: hypothetical protein EOO88_60920, partial [Pedobacter sp.]